MNPASIFEQIRRLRDPEDGCPWDREQTLEGYGTCVLGEAEELAEALASGDLEQVREEAGDLLWNLCFVVHLAEERGAFAGADVVRDVVAKMKRRHPHVYGDVSAATPEEALAAFRAAKAEEKRRAAEDET
ncbi:MAG: MazG nucleotide pyrophosphohydrolase domain-containing protein [Opitutales bacterium]